MNTIANHYNEFAARRDWFHQKNSYYYSLLFKQYRYFIPPGKKVLEVGCSTGDLLNAVEPQLGVGIDLSVESIKVAQEKYPRFKFFAGEISQFSSAEKFDVVILSGLLGELDDIQDFFEKLKKFCTKDTRIVIEYYSYFWQYILKFVRKWV